MKRLVTLALVLSACATSPTEVEHINDPVADNISVEGDPAAPATPAVRDLAVTCTNDLLQVTVTSAPKVVAASAMLARGKQAEIFDLDHINVPRPITTADGAFVGWSKTEVLDYGRLALASDSPLTCANVKDWGAMVVVDFADGSRACAYGGDRLQVALACPE